MLMQFTGDVDILLLDFARDVSEGEEMSRAENAHLSVECRY